MEKEDTSICVIVQDDINYMEMLYKEKNEALAQLERLIGTYETYGSFLITRPNYSEKANPNSY